MTATKRKAPREKKRPPRGRSLGTRIIDGLREAVAFDRGEPTGVMVRRAKDLSLIFPPARRTAGA